MPFATKRGLSNDTAVELHPIEGHVYRGRQPRPVAYGEGPYVNDRRVLKVYATHVIRNGKPVMRVDYESLSGARFKSLYLHEWLRWVDCDLTDNWNGWVLWTNYVQNRVAEMPPERLASPLLALLEDANELLQASRISTGRSAELTQVSGLEKLSQAVSMLRAHEQSIRKAKA